MHPFKLYVRCLSTIVVLVTAGCLSFGCGSSGPAYRLEKVSSVYTFEDKLAEPFGIAVHEGKIYVSDGQNGRIVYFVPGEAEVRTLDGFDTPSGIAVDPEGSILVADSGTNSIKRIGPLGTPEPVAGRDGERGFADGEAGSALFNGPVGIAAFSDSRIAVADTYNDRIRIIENGEVRTIAGNSKGFADGRGQEARFDTPLGLAVWNDEKLLVADSGNRRIRVVEPDGRVWTLIGDGGYELRDGLPADASLVSPTAVTVTENGIIFIADGNAVRAIGHRTFPYLETIAGGRRGWSDGTARVARFNRPSGLAAINGQIFVADSDNGTVRSIAGVESGTKETAVEQKSPIPFTPEEFRGLQPGRWPFEPPGRPREIAGTLGEIRGEIVDQTTEAWFHNGLDIPGAYGETARFIRDEKVLDPHAAQNFGTLRELIRMPTVGYVHIRLGRGSDGLAFADSRFLFETNAVTTKPMGVRVPRGSRFRVGEAIGTLNAMNHVHLIAGRPGGEMNALDALDLPGVSDSIPPVVQEIYFYNDAWEPIETKKGAERITLSGKTRVVVRAYDRMDGNAERRRLAPYRMGYVIASDEQGLNGQVRWTISFENMPPHEAVKFAYGPGSRSGATGETIFNFTVTNTVKGESFSEGFLDLTGLEPGRYTLRVSAGDRFGNISHKDISIEVIR